MVYVDPKDLGYEPFWQKWVNDRTNLTEHDELIRLYKKYVPSCIDLICEGIRDGKPGEKLKTIVPLTNLNLVRNFQESIVYVHFQIIL
jgi:dynein heavy chain